MQFKINDTTWSVEIRPMNELLSLYNERTKSDSDYCAGLTFRDQQKIWISKELHREQKIKVFIHELTHCWLWTYGHYYYDNINEECVCEIVAASHNFISKTKEQFVTKMLGDEKQ